MLMHLLSFIVVIVLIISEKKKETLIFLVIVLIKLFIPFISFNDNIALGTYSLILLSIIFYYYFVKKVSYLDKLSSLILSFITFLAIFTGEYLLPQEFRIYFIDKYILFGLIISFILFFLNEINMGGYVGSIWGILLFDLSSSYFKLNNINNEMILAGQNIFRLIISLSVLVAVLNFIQNYKSKASNISINNCKTDSENDLLRIITKDENDTNI